MHIKSLGFFAVLTLPVLYSAGSIAQDKTMAPPTAGEMKVDVGRMGDSIVVDPNTFKFSPAEEKIWMSNHLENINKPIRLYYEFVKSGTFEEGFTDAVYLDVVEINEDGTRNANLDFFSSDKKQDAGDDNLINITGNPVIGVYLQGDVYEMNRIAEGHWRYFHRRIKTAISETAVIEPISIEYNGKSIAAERITIQPYVKDPRRKQFEQFADKTYEFIFSKDVPGTLYEIRTVIPDTSGENKKALIKEVLTLQNVGSKG